MAPLVSRWVERVLGEHDPRLTLAQYLALESLAAGQGDATELARGAGVSRSAVSQLVSSLDGLGLVERSAADPDRRRQALKLSAGGRRALRSCRALLRRRLDPMLGALPPHEADELGRALGSLEETLRGTAPPRRPPRPHPPHRKPR